MTKPIKKNRTRVPLACLNIGQHTRLYSEDYFLQSLSPLGMSRRAFRCWMASLSVPLLEIGNTRFVDHLSLLIALRSILRIGNPTFLAAGCKTLSRKRIPPGVISSLDPAYVEANLHNVIAELLLAHTIAKDSRMSRKALVRVAREAATALVNHAYAHMPANSRAAIDKANTRRAARHPAFQPLPPPLPGGLKRPLASLTPLPSDLPLTRKS